MHKRGLCTEGALCSHVLQGGEHAGADDGSHHGEAEAEHKHGFPASPPGAPVFPNHEAEHEHEHSLLPAPPPGAPSFEDNGGHGEVRSWQNSPCWTDA